MVARFALRTVYTDLDRLPHDILLCDFIQEITLLEKKSSK